MKYNKTTLAQQLFDDAASALIALAKDYPYAPEDPVAVCDGLQWLRDQLANKPDMTLEELAVLYPQASGDRGAWAAGIMRDIGDKLYPELRAVFVNELHGDNCTMVAKFCRNRLSADEKNQLRKQFKAREEPSTDLERELI